MKEDSKPGDSGGEHASCKGHRKFKERAFLAVGGTARSVYLQWKD